uniref:Uncharacterized protein n=1 Tax=Panagrolaimus sp. JU765 TaxID=591449 RepID=A0AC34PWK0_9BILA
MDLKLSVFVFLALIAVVSSKSINILNRAGEPRVDGEDDPNVPKKVLLENDTDPFDTIRVNVSVQQRSADKVTLNTQLIETKITEESEDPFETPKSV